jgi:malonyl-CoA O-methyltransferase
MTAGDVSFHALRFGRAAGGYQARADIQARMADALLDLWGERLAPRNVLEFGCGTGLLTRRLLARFPGTKLLATDASAGMLEEARAAFSGGVAGDVADLASSSVRPDFVEQDASGATPPAQVIAARAPYDLIAAGALVQWFPDLARHLRFAGMLAGPGAHYLVSGFGRENFPELNALLSEPPFSYTSFPGHDPSSVEAAAQEAGWEPLAIFSWEEVEVLPTAREVLRRLQELGSVRDPREGGRMNRTNLAWLIAEYERRFARAGGVSLTWKPWAALLKRA